MSQKDRSRRSHRTVHISRKGQFALLGGSILVFLAGSACFAWAIADARIAHVQNAAQADAAQPVSPEELPPTETSVSAFSSASTEESDSAESTGTLSAVEGIVEAEPPAKPRKPAADKKPTQAKPASKKRRKKRTSKVGAVKKTERKPSSAAKRKRPAHAAKTMKVRHTAYEKIAVYRTQHHKASSFIESDAESAFPTREPCPVCGKQHEHGFAKRVLDHYEHRYCKACGKKHATSYVEIVQAR